MEDELLAYYKRLLGRERFLPKYALVYRALKGYIAAAGLSMGTKLPSIQALSKLFGTASATVSKAMETLIAEGHVRSVRGRGLFVSRPRLEINNTVCVALLLQSRGHVFSDLTHYLVNGIQNLNMVPLMADAMEPGETTDQQNLARIIGTDPAYIIIDGHKKFPYDVLEEHQRDSRLIFVNRSEEPYSNGVVQRVLSDYRHGGYLAIDHLLDCGATKIAFITYADTRPNTIADLRIKGAQQACREHGLDPDSCLTVLEVLTRQEQTQVLADILAGSRRPDGIFTSEDFRALDVYRTAARLGLSIPRDLKVVGYYDTPHCEVMFPSLTSISIGEKQLAAEVVKCIEAAEYAEETVYVKPQLIVRGSTVEDASGEMR